MKFKESGIEAKIVSVLDDDMPDVQARFVTKTRIRVKCGDRPMTGDAKTIRAALAAGAEVKFHNKSKTVTKKIHSAQVRSAGEDQLELTIIADGGLPIKQFVGGEEYIEPNISKLLGAKCECATFDVLSVEPLKDSVAS
jgi:tRNA pseudouridine synthase 10